MGENEPELSRDHRHATAAFFILTGLWLVTILTVQLLRAAS